MSVNGNINVYCRPPEEVANYLSGTGQLKLGKPDKVIEPTFFYRSFYSETV